MRDSAAPCACVICPVRYMSRVHGNIQRQGETKPSVNFVNRLLRTNFDIMNDLGDSVMKPFLQDVVQFDGLLQTLGQATVCLVSKYRFVVLKRSLTVCFHRTLLCHLCVIALVHNLRCTTEPYCSFETPPSSRKSYPTWDQRASWSGCGTFRPWAHMVCCTSNWEGKSLERMRAVPSSSGCED